MPCPRSNFRRDLETQLKSWIDKGDRLVVFIDANEDLAHGKMKSMFNRLHMHEAIHQRTGNKGPATWYRGKEQIDGVFMSQGLQ